MAYVRFATTCDRCGAASVEYTVWPSCRHCQQHTCGACQQPGSARDETVTEHTEWGDVDGETISVCCQAPTCLDLEADEVAS